MQNHILNRTEGVVLKKQAYKESGFLVELFTKDFGRITLFARGRANAKKPLNHLELFTYSAWHLKEGAVFYFVEEVDYRYTFRLSGKAIWTAYYLNELLLRTYPKDQPSEKLFNIYYRALTALYESKEIEPFLRDFELTLLMELGILPDLTTDALGDLIKSSKIYYLSFEEGLLPIKLRNTYAISGSLIEKISQKSFLNREESIQFRNMMRYLITPLLDGKPLQSRIWMQKLYGKNY